MSFSQDTPDPAQPTGLSSLRFLNRDNSILAFNERVLDLAKQAQTPLLERLRFLCIVSSNLDEFFEVRAEPHLSALRLQGANSQEAKAAYLSLSEAAHAIVEEQYRLYNDVLMPEFARQGIHLLSHGERNAAQRRWVSAYFRSEVRPLLIPVGLDPSHPFPMVANKSLNFIVRLGGKDAFGRENEIAIVKVPRVLPRIIKIPHKGADGQSHFVALSA